MANSFATETEYDALPYVGHPDPMIHPDRMASVAWIYGAQPLAVEKSRVLEIGCAAGSHLIPMAYQLPKASFVGFDFSSRQIALARKAATAIGLNNIQFEVRDIRDDHQDLGVFDYIIAHGVFSWVPRPVQESLLNICRQHLSPAGIALVDYNVYPGWHLRGLLRDLVTYHRGEHSDPGTSMNEALDSLDYIGEHLFAPASPFGLNISHLRRWTQAQARNYLTHEFGSEGHAVLFSEFAQRARSHGLEILGDAQITHVVPAAFTDSLTTKVRDVAGTDFVRQEQFLDFLRGRDFRRTLLVLDNVQVAREPSPRALRRLRFSTIARREATSHATVFRCPDGTMLQSSNTQLVHAMETLCNAGPAGMMFDAIYGRVFPKDNELSGPMAEQLGQGLLEAAAGGIIQPHTYTPNVVGEVRERPVANAVAMEAARAGQCSITSMLHRDWQIDEFERQLLCVLDGAHDRPALEEILVQKLMRREITFPAQSFDIHSDLRKQVTARLSQSLQWLARVGVLIG